LGEFGLAVRSQVLVAETLHDLEVLFEARHHKDLFEQLRGLRQCIKIAHAEAGSEPGNRVRLRGRFRENRRFDFPETLRVHVLANRHRDAVPHPETFLHFRAAQIEISVLQSQVFRRVDLVLDRERCCLRLVQKPQFAHHDFDLACFEIGIGQSVVSHTHTTAGSDHKLRSQRLPPAV
jgi:hypothetical protein